VPASVHAAVGLCLLAGAGDAAPYQQRIPRQDAARTGAVQGIVRSPEGRALGGVRLVFRHLAGRETVVVNTGDGVFLLRDLTPGAYSIRATLDGFEPLLVENREVAAHQPTTIELTLKRLAAGATAPEVLPLHRFDAASGPSTYHVLIPRGPEMAVAEVDTPLAEDDEVFTPVANRWNLKLPDFRRFDTPGDGQFVQGNFFDPFNTNKLKGDVPVLGHRIFLNLGFVSDTLNAGQTVPLPPIPFKNNPQHYGFGQYAMSQNFAMTVDLSQGDAAYRPVDWRIRVTADVDLNYVGVKAPGLLDFNQDNTTRFDRHTALQEAFGELKLKDLSNEYDFVSIRGGIQAFNSDFRGFIFSVSQPAVRIFGNLDSNRYQYNLAAFDMLGKDPNSGLLTFDSRHQRVYIANLYRQDFFIPGYTVEVSFHYDKDDPSTGVNRDGFMVRPVPFGGLMPRSERAYYYGFAGDGHWGRINLTHAFYQVLGTDKYNPFAEHAVSINARMAALELSLDRNWLRYRASFFYASGDRNPTGKTATGFDSIDDNPNFGGGAFSYWDRVSLVGSGAGINITDGNSLVPDLRTSKADGQANFVNPGLFLYNAGVDADLTPRLRLFTNLNLIRFADTEPLELLLGLKNIHAGAGADSGIGVTYRPKLSGNISFTAGFNAFFPFEGFHQIYTGRTLFGVFSNMRFRF
jgi:hypothetical protein